MHGFGCSVPAGTGSQQFMHQPSKMHFTSPGSSIWWTNIGVGAVRIVTVPWPQAAGTWWG